MFTSSGIYLFFIVALQVVYFFVDVNLTQTVSPKKTGMAASKIDSIKGLNSRIYCQKYTHSTQFYY
jgi:hypothetical protein